MIEKLVGLADAYCEVSGQSRSAASKEIFQRGGHIDDLAAGNRDIATGTFERALNWFSSRWPDGAAWPADIARPDKFTDDASGAGTTSSPSAAAGSVQACSARESAEQAAIPGEAA